MHQCRSQAAVEALPHEIPKHERRLWSETFPGNDDVTSVCTPSCPINDIAVDDTNDNQLVFGEFLKDFTAGLIFLGFPTLGRFSRRLAVFGSNEQDG